MKGKFTAVLLWLLMCLAPLFAIFFVMVISFIVLFLSSGNAMIDFGRIGGILMLINPLYQAVVNYHFITKKNAFFIWLFLVVMQTPWYFPYLFRENDEWLAIPILISYIGHYQIIGITICFAIACLTKYLVSRHKAKKALVEVETENTEQYS